MKKFYLVSLGCPKNLVDAEQMIGLLAEKGYILTRSAQQADILLLNTCAFLQEAVAESCSWLQKMKRWKKQRRQKLIVTGCLVQRWGKNLFRDEQIDGLMGTGDPGKIRDVVTGVLAGRRVFRFSRETFQQQGSYPRLVTTGTYAYLKIAEGCSNFCRYCLIPSLRGVLRSRPVDEILAEADALFHQGVKELIIIAQDTTAYGQDLKPASSLAQLLEKLGRISFPWIRILYAHPGHLTEKLLQVMAENRSFCRYLDLPLQHAHPEILKKMNRPVLDYRQLIRKVREMIPGIHLRSSFIVGFPGEKERHFQYLVDFLKDVKLEKVGVFAYSREKKTPAYDDLGHLPSEVIQKRRNYLLQVQRKISREKLKKMVGKTVRVLVERKNGKNWLGRTEFDAPEIDGQVIIQAERLTPGSFLAVRITGSTDYDLQAKAE